MFSYFQRSSPLLLCMGHTKTYKIFRKFCTACFRSSHASGRRSREWTVSVEFQTVSTVNSSDRRQWRKYSRSNSFLLLLEYPGRNSTWRRGGDTGIFICLSCLWTQTRPACRQASSTWSAEDNWWLRISTDFWPNRSYEIFSGRLGCAMSSQYSSEVRFASNGQLEHVEEVIPVSSVNHVLWER